MKKILFFAAITLIAACSGSKKVKEVLPEAPKGVQFMQSDKLMPVLAAAGEEDKLVFVDFYTSWCLPCKLMDEDVFTDEVFATYMNDNFINYKVDAEKGNGANLAMLYQVAAYPTLLFLDKDGNILTQKVGAAYQTELRKMGEEAKRLNNSNVE